MFWLWLVLALSLLLALGTILEIASWIYQLIRRVLRLQEQQLWREDLTRLGIPGMSALTLSVLTLVPYFSVHLWVEPQQTSQDPWAIGLASFAG